TQDAVQLQWVNASAYDSVRVYRDGTRIARVNGNVSQYTDHVDRGLHSFEVSGFQAGTETARVRDDAFAGVLTCYATDDFESGNANNWSRPESAPGNHWDVTPMASGGLFGFTDSPAGLYRGCPVGDCPLNTIAELGVPAKLRAHASLEWDQICITEPGFDYCI